jgi:Flp pilus assembly protein TadG
VGLIALSSFSNGVPARAISAGRRLLRRAPSERGQALVELALVIPILMLVLLGIFDFGRAVNYWNDENQLAEQAARVAAVGSLPTTGPCANQSNLVSFVQCQAGLDSGTLASGTTGGQAGIQSPGVKVCVTTAKDTSGNTVIGNPVTVTINAAYNWLALPKFLGGSTTIAPITLTGTATMRLEDQMPSGWINNTC